MPTINVLLQAKARDKGVHKWLTTSTKLADKFAASLGRAEGKLGQASRAEAKLGQASRRVGSRGLAPDRPGSIATIEAAGHPRASTRRSSEPARGQSRRSSSSGGQRLELAENLATAGAEFDQFGSKVERGIRGSFDAFTAYEKKVAEIGTITESVTLGQIDAIAKAAVGEFGGEPIKQAEALQKVMSMGASTAAEAQAQLMAANKLGIAGSANVADSVTAISKTVENFDGVSAQQAADAIFAVTQASSAEVGDLAQAFPRVAAAAAGAGLTLGETIGTIGTMSNKLGGADEAVTALIGVIGNIQKPTQAARDEAEKLGIDFSVAGVEAAGGWEQFLLKLRAAENFDEDTIAKLFDSSNARLGIAALTGDMEGLRKGLAAQETAVGGTEKAYTKMTDTTAHKAALLEGQFEMLKIQAGQQLVPALLGVADAIGPVIKGASEWIAANPNLAATIAKVAVGTVVAAKGVGGLISAYSMWQTITGITQLGNVKLAGSTDTLTSAVTKQGAAMSTTSKLGGGMSKMVGALPGIFAIAGAGIVAFDMVLDRAQSSLVKYEDRLNKIEGRQKNISFWRAPTAGETEKFEADKKAKLEQLEEKRKAAKGRAAKEAVEIEIAAVTATAAPAEVQRSDEDVLRDQRQNLVDAVKAAREAVTESTLGGVGKDANLFEKGLGGLGGMLNAATGVTDEYDRQRQQAERDLEDFDKREGDRLGIGLTDYVNDGLGELNTGRGGIGSALAGMAARWQAAPSPDDDRDRFLASDNAGSQLGTMPGSLDNLGTGPTARTTGIAGDGSLTVLQQILRLAEKTLNRPTMGPSMEAGLA